MNLPPRDSDGRLPAFAWPGGYLISYLDREGNTLCADCASRNIDERSAVIGYVVHEMGGDLEGGETCDDCGRELDPAERGEVTS